MSGPAEDPGLWAFLSALRRGDLLSGTVAAIEPFGVFVALDDGPGHPDFPGVGFITAPELSWGRFEAMSDVVHVGQRVTCEFLQFDTWHLEARLSLRATQPDPLQALVVGQELHGRVAKVVPFGAFVEVADGILGLVHQRELDDRLEVAQVGDAVTVVVTDIDRERRRLVFSRQDGLADRR